MSVVRHRLKSGAYFDSVVLMQLQRRLAERDGVEQAGVVMATAANLELLEETGLHTGGVEARPDDLLIVVEARTEAIARKALAAFEDLVADRRSTSVGDYRPKSLATAIRQRPDADWVLVSVPGEHAGLVTRQALEADRHVFLYSDNVPVAEEVALKELAAERDRMVLGPDCGTAMIGGVGFGFANRVRAGRVGIVAASGTGLQTIAARIHQLGEGVSQGIGTGGRDLSRSVGGKTALRALHALTADPATEVIVVVSKPPHPDVAVELLATAAVTGKPTVIHFQGDAPPGRRMGPLRFAVDLEDAASTAVALLADAPAPFTPEPAGVVRGLFSGGTLANEALLRLEPLLPSVASNLEGRRASRLVDLAPGAGHVIVDLGADQFTVGRPHPMIDPQIVAEHLAHCAADREVGTVLLDVVLGDGAHPDPAAVFDPAIRQAVASAGRDFAVVALLVGTEEDPQDREAQRGRLEEAGATVVDELGGALDIVLRRTLTPAADAAAGAAIESSWTLERPAAAINVGVELFHDSLDDQGVEVVHVDWRPPAGGNEKLARILARLRQAE